MEMTSIKEKGSVIAMEDQLSWVGLTDRQKQHTNPLLRRDGRKESLLTNAELVQWVGHRWKSEIEHAITLDTYLKKVSGNCPCTNSHSIKHSTKFDKQMFPHTSVSHRTSAKKSV